ncbi:uncharacterized protein I303_106058 [Kwoniella dejecticola CBS 10117]|uniref:Uncharacterized protein n=1 Tax=Kwoniella dejecticola CBS 10117 TaxID=1296121 RepID=A0A1A6A162_9TREE|nr:uncharacterized protein I303_06078 [Kwoniella dejecticola CBS 10117]OBR83795.1 hypothetical protein I303_06078 [Kwoniella dejecticola CBS 10117]
MSDLDPEYVRLHGHPTGPPFTHLFRRMSGVRSSQQYSTDLDDALTVAHTHIRELTNMAHTEQRDKDSLEKYIMDKVREVREGASDPDWYDEVRSTLITAGKAIQSTISRGSRAHMHKDIDTKAHMLNAILDDLDILQRRIEKTERELSIATVEDYFNSRRNDEAVAKISSYEAQ